MTDYIKHLTMLPDYMRDAVQRYIEKGISGGSFLDAVVRHELFEAVGRADLINQRALVEYVKYFYNYTPSGCHGSNERVDAWIIKGGLEGLEQKETVE